MTDEEKLKANADLVVKLLTPTSKLPGFGFNRESVAWVEGYIERLRDAGMTDEARGLLGQKLGCFLGQCLIATYGGKWRTDERGYGVVLDKGGVAYPLSKVHKQFADGAAGGQSILSFFDITGKLAQIFSKGKEHRDKP
jgi:hypothetical protein